MPYETWLQANAPTYMQDQYGRAWLGGIGAAFDDYVQQYVAGTLAAFPDFAPADALGIIGDELGLDRGPFETDQQYTARLVGAWTMWKYAGTPVGLLVALYWAGFGGGYIVTQNGPIYSLSGTPVAGADPSALISMQLASQLAVALTSNVTPPTAAQPGRVIPAGNPWWQFAESRAANTNACDTDMCSRFAIIYPNAPLPSAFFTWARATFSGTDSAAITWNNPFPTSSYLIMPGIPTITSGGPASVWADGSTQTLTGVTIRASAAITGTVDVIASQIGANPLADLHPNELNRLQSAIRKWRPGKASCVGVYALVQGKFMGWPVQTQATNTMGPWSIVRFEGAQNGS